MRAKQFLKMARKKKYYGKGRNCIRIAAQRVTKALQHQYRERKTFRREIRQLWITQINAAARQHELPYSSVIQGMVRTNIALNRKMLADLAQHEPVSFASVLTVLKEDTTLRRVNESLYKIPKYTTVPLDLNTMSKRGVPFPEGKRL